MKDAVKKFYEFLDRPLFPSSRLLLVVRPGYRFFDESRTRFATSNDLTSWDVTAYVRYRWPSRMVLNPKGEARARGTRHTGLEVRDDKGFAASLFAEPPGSHKRKINAAGRIGAGHCSCPDPGYDRRQTAPR